MGSRGASALSRVAAGVLEDKDAINRQAEAYGATASNLKKLKGKLSEEELIEKLGIYEDRGHGTCNLLALAYIGNKAGFDVTPSTNDKNINFISGAYANWMKRERDKDTKYWWSGKTRGSEFKAVTDAISSMKIGKEYFMNAGKHAAIARINPKTKKFEYLELQGGKANGWTSVSAQGLRKRFGVNKGRRKEAGVDFSRPTFLMDISTFASQKNFKEVLKYV